MKALSHSVEWRRPKRLRRVVNVDHLHRVQARSRGGFIAIPKSPGGAPFGAGINILREDWPTNLDGTDRITTVFSARLATSDSPVSR